MRFCVLGPVELAADGRRVTLGSERQRTIVAVLLAARGEVVSTDRLIDGVWGAQPPASAHKSLHSHVSRLRRTLVSVEPAGAHALATAVDGYRIDPAACDLDADIFEDLLSQAHERLASDPGRAVELLGEARSLWRGAAFGDLAGHELVSAEAVRLERLREAAAGDRVDALLTLGRHEEVLGALEARLTQDPLDERAHGQHMVALYRGGHQAEALATYRRLQQRLSDEVGIDPSEELQRLHERILRQETGLSAPHARHLPAQRPSAGQTRADGRSGATTSPADPPSQTRADGRSGATSPADPPSQTRADGGSGATSPADPSSLTAGSSRLIGREQDAAAVAALVTSASLVTLIGAGGVGKTRLAEQVAGAVAEQFDDGVAVCPLAAVRDPESVRVALIDALEAQNQGDRPAEETLLASVGTRRLLLVLDNCEHLLAAVSEVVSSLRARCPNVVVLATSREHLHLSGERVWQVAPLAVPPAGASPAEVMDAPAGALFCARAEAAEPSFALTADNAAAVGELCRRLDGVPLAIELAAARVRAMSPGDLLERIDQRFSLLTGGPLHETGRHRTLQAVVSWSYDLLGEAEARLFDRLSVFAGSFPLSAAERVCASEPLTAGDVAGVLAELVDKSMVAVERTDGGVRYRLLDTLRDFGAARLADSGDAGRYQRAHAAYCVAFAEALGPRVRGADEGPALAEIDAAVDDLRVGHGWLVAAGDVDGALRLPVALRDYIGHRQRDEMVTWAERALDLPGASAHPAHPAALATVARGATRRGDLARARRDAEAAFARAEPGSVTAIWALHAQATAALYEGRLDDLLALADRQDSLARQSGEGLYLAMTGMMRVLAHMYRGDARTAAAHAVEFREAAEASGNHGVRAWALYSHGEALLDTDPAAAVPLLERAIEVADGVDSHVTKGVALVSLGSLCGRQGDTDRALGLFRDVVAHWRRLGDYTHQLTTLRNLVELLARVGADHAAGVLYGAVTTASRPSFGAEAERLEAAWAQVEQRLGAEAAGAAAERGRQLTDAETIDVALATLDDLRAA